MINNIIRQQFEERNILLNQTYITRIDDDSIANFQSTNLIKLITGPRRAGKSVTALQMLKNQNFAYLNFDDDLLIKHFNENQVIQALNEIYYNYKFLLLDEIQNLSNWELWVNKLYRRGSNLVITGSNAKLLSHEMASSLTGRYIQIAIFPFSFPEVLQFNENLNPSPNKITPGKIGEILNLLNKYMISGGFPETIITPVILKNYLSTLFDSILLKDILKRFRIRQPQQLYDLASYLLSNYTSLFSANQLKTDLNFNSVATVQKFLAYLEESFLFINLPCYSNKIKTQQKKAKKIYVIDNGFINAKAFELSPNYGRLLENIIFIELLRNEYKPGLNLFYYRTRNNKEIDFMLRSGHSIKQLIQVCYNIKNSKTLKRETNALIEASGELKCTSLLLITWDDEEIIIKDNLKIQLIPAYKWLQNLKH